MELTSELKELLGKRAVEIYASLRFGELPPESFRRDPDVFLKEEFNQALQEYLSANVESKDSDKKVEKEIKSKPVRRSKKKS
jgi:hypothetical protein